jgi:hypothetical protein
MDRQKFNDFDKIISGLADNVIRKVTARLMEKWTNLAKTYSEFYDYESLGLQIPESREETLLELERKYPGIAGKIMDYFINTPREVIEDSVTTSVLG